MTTQFHEATARNFTIEEALRYGVAFDVDVLIQDVEAETAYRTEKSFERAEEQSEFRAELLQTIQRLCEHSPARYKETKQLIADIAAAIENSYVEL